MTKHDKNLRNNNAVNGLAGTELVDIERLVPNDRNARTHNLRQIKKIAASIQQFGFVNPVLIDAENGIVAGHGRVEAAKRLGLEKVPTLRVEHLSDADKRAYILADNRLAEDAGWDEDILAIELQGLIDMDVSIELTGFELAEVDRIIEGQGSSASDMVEGPADELVPVDKDAAPITKELWLNLGDG